MTKNINIGVNVFVVRQEKLLLGKRKNCFGAGEWGLPGGHMEFNESFSETAARELKEETGMIAKDFTFSNIVSQTHREAGHYIQIGMIPGSAEGEPENLEPHTCEKWEWFPLDSIPENVFSAHRKQIRLFKEGVPLSEE